MVAEAAVGTDREGAVLRAGYHLSSQAVAVNIDRTGQWVNDDVGVFVNTDAAACQRWRVVDCGDVDSHRS